MTNEEKRLDAAHMLGVNYDATPDTINDAYMNRLRQFMDIECAGDLFSRKVINLYDARVRMSYPANAQWRANWKLMTTSHMTKHCETGVSMLRVIQNSGVGPLTDFIADGCIDLISQIKTRHKVLRALLKYNLTGLGGMMVYDHVSPDHGPLVGTIVYGSMLVAGISMGVVMASLDKKRGLLSGGISLLRHSRMK